MPMILVVGAGPVGHTLAAGLTRAGYPLHHWSRSRGPLWQEGEPAQAPDVVVLAVRDDVIREAARFVVSHGGAGPDTVLLHCAGALPPQEVFAEQRDQVKGCGLLHPLRSLTQGGLEASGGAVDLTGTVIAVSGDEAGLATAQSLALALGGVPLLLSAEQLGAYHGIAALCAGHVAALLSIGAAALTQIGLPRHHAEQALAALCRSAADNVSLVGLPAAVTGPFARGDVGTVARHLQSLAQTSPAAEQLYRVLAPEVLRLARDKGAASPQSLDEIAALLEVSQGRREP